MNLWRRSLAETLVSAPARASAHAGRGAALRVPRESNASSEQPESGWPPFVVIYGRRNVRCYIAVGTAKRG